MKTNKEQERKRSNTKLGAQANLHSAAKFKSREKTNKQQRKTREIQPQKQTKQEGKTKNIKETNDDI